MQLKAVYRIVHVVGVNETHDHPRHRATESGEHHLSLMNPSPNPPLGSRRELSDPLGSKREGRLRFPPSHRWSSLSVTLLQSYNASSRFSRSWMIAAICFVYRPCHTNVLQRGKLGGLQWQWLVDADKPFSRSR